MSTFTIVQTFDTFIKYSDCLDITPYCQLYRFPHNKSLEDRVVYTDISPYLLFCSGMNFPLYGFEDNCLLLLIRCSQGDCRLSYTQEGLPARKPGPSQTCNRNVQNVLYILEGR